MLAKITYGSEKRRKITEKSVAEREHKQNQKSETRSGRGRKYQIHSREPVTETELSAAGQSAGRALKACGASLDSPATEDKRPLPCVCLSDCKR